MTRKKFLGMAALSLISAPLALFNSLKGDSETKRFKRNGKSMLKSSKAIEKNLKEGREALFYTEFAG